MKYRLNYNIHNRFDIEVIDSKSNSVKSKAYAENVVCNNIWKILNGSAFGNQFAFYIQIGSGSGTPSEEDTTLFSWKFAKRLSALESGMIDAGVFASQYRATIETNELINTEISEVGLSSNSNGNIATHALLKDMNGNPVSILKTDTDVINILVTVYVVYDATGYSNNVFLTDERGSGIAVPGVFEKSYSHFLKWISGAEPRPSSSFGTIFSTYGNASLPSGGTLSLYRRNEVTTSAIFTYDPATRKVNIKSDRLKDSEYNTHGIMNIIFGDNYHPQNELTPMFRIMCYDNVFNNHVTSESVGIGDGSTKDYRVKFHYAKNPIVYIDGEVTTDYTLDYIYQWDDINSTDKALDAMISLDKNYNINKAPSDFPNMENRKYWYKPTGYFYNPMYKNGLKELLVVCANSNVNHMIQATVWGSNNFGDWVLAGKKVSRPSSSSTQYAIEFSEEEKHYKYWKINLDNGDPWTYYRGTLYLLLDKYDNRCLHFNTPPAEGSVITIDYDCDCIPKDDQHVLDIEIEVQLGSNNV